MGPAMIDRTMLKEHLALERRSITEIATGLSAATVVGATLYNLGFFAPIEWSLISLLTVQDLLVGAGVAQVPMAAAAWIAMMMGRLIRSAPKRRVIAITIGLPVFVLAGIGFGTFFSGPLQWTLGHLACGYLMLGVFAAGANMVLSSRHLPVAWLIFSLIYTRRCSVCLTVSPPPPPHGRSPRSKRTEVWCAAASSG